MILLPKFSCLIIALGLFALTDYVASRKINIDGWKMGISSYKYNPFINITQDLETGEHSLSLLQDLAMQDDIYYSYEIAVTKTRANYKQTFPLCQRKRGAAEEEIVHDSLFSGLLVGATECPLKKDQLSTVKVPFNFNVDTVTREKSINGIIIMTILLGIGKESTDYFLRYDVAANVK